MTVGDLKGWIKSLPDSFDDMSVVFRKYESIETEKKEEPTEENADYYYALDAPVSSGFIDEESRELCFLDEKSRQFIVDMNSKLSKGDNQEISGSNKE